jgi:hypothetical protein
VRPLEKWFSPNLSGFSNYRSFFPTGLPSGRGRHYIGDAGFRTGYGDK